MWMTRVTDCDQECEYCKATAEFIMDGELLCGVCIWEDTDGFDVILPILIAWEERQEGVTVH